MKTISFTQNFKIVGEKSATAEHPKGSKRKSVIVSYQGLEASDVAVTVAIAPNLPEAAHVAFAANELIEQYAKHLFAVNSGDWNYVPAAADLTLAAAYQWMTTTASKTRAVTAATLVAFAQWYVRQAIVLLGKSQKSADAGALVITQKLVPIMGNNAAITAFSGNLVALAEAVAAKDDERLSEELLSHNATYDWLMEKLGEAIVVSVSDL